MQGHSDTQYTVASELFSDVTDQDGVGERPKEGNSNPLQYSCLGNPMDRAWRTTISWDHKKSEMIEQLTHTHTHTKEKCLTESNVGNTVPSPGGNKGISQYVPGGMSKDEQGWGMRTLDYGMEEE